ncbi:formate hydrogenlyase maturation HycH family protein [Brenneria izbisi]|uniref:Formate hydrogenlyase maturation HycH family protein n=1 Tax=Brenneria izbisi TaxID=2939450 RepID=A0AA41Y2D4_9GAMM|nr:formate hydrogenlyase maturation HycH family protein [Brenneria izbisi]MCV9878131.1 formate hydrogenlyase maturation HycH family protein [Brenneria izbisi]MCV9881305.1 formate hydrogenlyase maturation HycH family protein [Brenneria izbisi]
MSTQVIFYALNQKFLDAKDTPDIKSRIPEQAQQVMYYSLSIGHHVGVIDCLKKILICPQSDYQRWIAQLPPGEALRKMAGLLKFGEITIDGSHTQLLGRAFGALGAEQDRYAAWTQTLLTYLAAIERESALYLMVKRIDG